MRHLLPLIAALTLSTTLAAVDVPEGQNVVVEPVIGTGFIKIATADNRMAYLLNVDWILGVQIQQTGVYVTFEADKGKQKAFFAIPAERFIEAIVAARK